MAFVDDRQRPQDTDTLDDDSNPFGAALETSIGTIPHVEPTWTTRAENTWIHMCRENLKSWRCGEPQEFEVGWRFGEVENPWKVSEYDRHRYCIGLGSEDYLYHIGHLAATEEKDKESHQEMLKHLKQMLWQTQKHNSKRAQKFGDAPAIQVFRSSAQNLKGTNYVNKKGKPYCGSVCDWCEERGHSHFHHPLRCHRQFPGWKTKGAAPELNGVTAWYVRGGHTDSLGSGCFGTREPQEQPTQQQE
jgi:hypothetical protein